MIQNLIIPETKLPELTNPATTENVDTGYQIIDSTGSIVTGTSNKVDLSAATATAADIKQDKPAGLQLV